MGVLTLRKKFLFIGTVFLFSTTFTLIALEVYVRTFRPMIDLNHVTGRTTGPNPNAEWAFLDAFSAYRGKPGIYKGNEGRTINRHGFISTPDISVFKPPGTLRIVFLGGSSTAGTKLRKDQETWPWKTVEMIRDKTRGKVDFINGALGGYTSFESYGRLWSRIRHFSPDIIVVYHGWNEM